MSETQTVVEEPNGQVMPPPAEVSGVQTEESQDNIDLEALLSEWDNGEKQKAVEPVKEEVKTEPKSDDDVKAILEYVKSQKQRDDEVAERQIKEDYEKTVKSLKGDLPVSEKVVDGYLRLRAAEDPRILSAYQQRHKNPEVWSRVEKAIQSEIRNELKALPDKASTDTRRQIADAIQSAQSTNDAISSKDTKDMSDNEFQIHLSKLVNE